MVSSNQFPVSEPMCDLYIIDGMGNNNLLVASTKTQRASDTDCSNVVTALVEEPAFVEGEVILRAIHIF